MTFAAITAIILDCNGSIMSVHEQYRNKEDAMFLEIAGIRKGTGGVTPLDYDIDVSEQYSDGISYFSDVHISGEIKNTAGVMLIKAKITCIYHTECYRCLEKTDLNVETDIETIFDLYSSKDDSLVIENGKIDLSKTCFDALTLSLPMQIFCDNDCDIAHESDA